MYLYLGADRSVKNDRILGIFDMDTATVSPVTRSFLAKAQRDGRVEAALEANGIPKSFVLSDGGRVCLSQYSPNSLRGRVPSRHGHESGHLL